MSEPLAYNEKTADLVSEVGHPGVRVLNEAAALMEKKSQDYTSTDPFENFRHVAEATGLSVDQVIHSHIANKMARLNNLLALLIPGNQNFESVEDTLLDLANYSALLVAWRRRENNPISRDSRGETVDMPAPGGGHYTVTFPPPLGELSWKEKRPAYVEGVSLVEHDSMHVALDVPMTAWSQLCRYCTDPTASSQ